jgi:hypothetical protein
MLLKPPEVVIPEPLVVREPVPHRTEPRGDEAIAALSAMPLLRHETGSKQDAEVLGDSRATHLELSRNGVNGAVAFEEEIEHPSTCGMANCPEGERETSLPSHWASSRRRSTRARMVMRFMGWLGRDNESRAYHPLGLGAEVGSGPGKEERECPAFPFR